MSFLQGQDKQFLEMGEMAGYGQFGVVLDRFPTRIGRFAEERRRPPASSGPLMSLLNAELEFLKYIAMNQSALYPESGCKIHGWNVCCVQASEGTSKQSEESNPEP